MTDKPLSQIIQERLIQQLSATNIDLKDQSYRHRRHPGAKDGGGHYALTISSPLFKDKSLVECHRMIYQVLGDLIPAKIHALQITIH